MMLKRSVKHPRLRGIGNGCMRQPLQPLDKTELEVFRKQLEPFF